MLTAEDVIDLLHLQPHTAEGGFFRETYRSDDILGQPSLPARYSGDRSLGTAIYYLLTPDTFSAMHRLESDEIFHFYFGDPVTMLQLLPDGTGRNVTLGSDLEAGHMPQVIVPRGVWQGSILNEGGRFALMGTTVSPGFDPEDFEIGVRGELVESYRDWSTLIQLLTRAK